MPPKMNSDAQLKLLHAKRDNLFARMQLICDSSSKIEDETIREMFLCSIETVDKLRLDFENVLDRINTLELELNPEFLVNYDALSSFEDLVCRTKRVAKSLEIPVESKPALDSVWRQDRPKLPPIQIPEFDGDIKNWPLFYACFENTIHRNNGLSNHEKLHYLVGKLTGKAKSNRVDKAKLVDAISSRWGVKPGDEKYPYYVKFVTTVAHSNLYHLDGFEEFKDDSSLEVDFYKLVFEVQPKLKVKTSWSVKLERVNWFPVITEAGACYATNTLVLPNIAFKIPTVNETKIFPITCLYSSGNCNVYFEVEEKGIFYVHSPYDAVDIISGGSPIIPLLNRASELSVIKIGPGRGVRDLPLHRRGCRFIDEPLDNGEAVYSLNTCRQSCRSKLALQLCGCKPFYYSYEEGSVCTAKGMHCLSQYAQKLITDVGKECRCSPQCLEATFTEISTMSQTWKPTQFIKERGFMKLSVPPPRSRYTREIVFYFQDLVVSFGGAAGLFLGASFISLVEIFYFIIGRSSRACCKRKDGKEKGTTKAVQINSKEPSICYEAKRILELTAILENQRRLDYS
ncbi:unnamed protein product [Chilo suppressalis]|uniref:Sodium channel protein Nach n=1 Tax=Chilo suppressalis TaxID=168631 RepID=A0ABN8B8R2_CHISP|nr:unnamed protein product [Chilo suppressalis]